MPLNVKLDPDQLMQLLDLQERTVDSIDRLSENLAKWQGEMVTVVREGLDGLIETLGGEGGDLLQQRIDALSSDVETEADAFEGAANKNKQPTE